MRPINLLPPEVAEERSRRRRVGLVVVGIIAYLALLGFGVLYWNSKVTAAREDVATQRDSNQLLEREVVALGDAGELQNEYQDRSDLVRTALATDVDWGILLNDLARLIPPRVWVETFSGTLVPPTTPGVLGQVGFSGIGFDFPDVSAWLRALDSEQFNGVTGTWVSTVSEGVIGEADVVIFTSTAVLTSAAATNRAETLIPEVP
jgi:Tfp pilus assembly protein PilN